MAGGYQTPETPVANRATLATVSRHRGHAAYGASRSPSADDIRAVAEDLARGALRGAPTVRASQERG